MACGSGDYACQFATVLLGHASDLSAVLTWIPWLETKVREHLQAIIGLLGFAFGVWKWWFYREKVLHKRLSEYIAENNRLLAGARSEVLSSIERPGMRRSFDAPLFAVRPLRRLLEGRGWIGWSTADRRLQIAEELIESRLDLARRNLAHRNEELATALILRGAIAAVRAKGGRANPRPGLDEDALKFFRRAQQLPGVSHQLEAREYEAHQLRRLGILDRAEKAYGRLEGMARARLKGKEQAVVVSRALRHKAEIWQAQAAGGTTSARDVLDLALHSRAQYGPYSGWDALEQAEIHLLQAYVCSRLFNHHNRENEQLQLAADEYQRVIDAIPKLIWVFSRTARELRRAARQGQGMVEAIRSADAAERNYGASWLQPRSG